jgi:hypothetical protein
MAIDAIGLCRCCFRVIVKVVVVDQFGQRANALQARGFVKGFLGLHDHRRRGEQQRHEGRQSKKGGHLHDYGRMVNNVVVGSPLRWMSVPTTEPQATIFLRSSSQHGGG